MSSLLKFIDEVDFQATKWVYENIGRNKNKYIAKMPYYLGLLPYELYVLPGMFIAIFVMFFSKTFHPVQFHLLPHWFSFSMALYIKHNFSRIRPGCTGDLNRLIDPKHCHGSTMYQSFPSGHTIIAVTLATTLYMYLFDPTVANEDKNFLGIPFYDDVVKTITVSFGFLVAFMISLHRVSYGYHHVGDVLIGALLGYCIGYGSYTVSNTMRVPAASADHTDAIWSAVRGLALVLSVAAFLHFFIFKFHKLSAIQH